jgi:hypothetical protein
MLTPRLQLAPFPASVPFAAAPVPAATVMSSALTPVTTPLKVKAIAVELAVPDAPSALTLYVISPVFVPLLRTPPGSHA